jgi:hypothetical protein
MVLVLDMMDGHHSTKNVEDRYLHVKSYIDNTMDLQHGTFFLSEDATGDLIGHLGGLAQKESQVFDPGDVSLTKI